MRRIEFLERELDQAKTDMDEIETLRSDLKQREDECKELQEALEELEGQQQTEVRRAIESARREWQEEICQVAMKNDRNTLQSPGADDSKASSADVAIGKLKCSGAEFDGAGGEGNPVGTIESDSRRERECSGRAVEHRDDALESSQAHELENMKEQLDLVSEERNQLQVCVLLCLLGL